ncbi:DsbE family thiol:disulfide interchange protein [Flavisphingomonas formosensis]|uniref:DsbE family thiol:disulfide interchange protein n=1 Tax=Flavisphingomonas formosensis TaxID=861534 RepID=UPI0012F9A9EC|nr:DsbE family thiol:disulfide interchange protein [Sphingomonas formosensis]
MKKAILWAPLAMFLIFAAMVAGKLYAPGDSSIVSHMVGKPLPAFALPAGMPDRPGLANTDFAKGKPRLLNIFASWCVPCAAEAPQLVELRKAGVEIDAIAIRDRPEDIAEFLKRYGDPYARIGSDANSSVQVAMGSSGVPESFVIDGQGIIRHQHIGDIRPENVPDILAAIRAAQ